MKKRVTQIFGWVVGGISLYIFVWYFFDWEKTKQILTNTNKTTIGLAAIGFVVTCCLRIFKWTYLVRCQESISWGDGYHTMMVSSLANFVLPVRFGEILKLVIAKKTSNISYATSTAASIIDTFTLTFFIFLFLCLTPLTGFKIPLWISNFSSVFIIFVILSIGLFLYGIRFSDLIKRWIQHLLLFLCLEQNKVERVINGKIVQYLENTLKQCHISAFTKLDILIVMALSFMTVCTDGFCNYFLISAFGLSISYPQAILAACFFNVLFFLPSPPGRVGTAEIYPILIFSGIFHLPPSIISASAILWHLLTAMIIAVLGINSMISLGLQLKTVLNLTPEGKQTIQETND